MTNKIILDDGKKEKVFDNLQDRTMESVLNHLKKYSEVTPEEPTVEEETEKEEKKE